MDIQGKILKIGMGKNIKFQGTLYSPRPEYTVLEGVGGDVVHTTGQGGQHPLVQRINIPAVHLYSCSTLVLLQYTCAVVVHLYTLQLQYTCTVAVHLYSCSTLVQLQYTCIVAVHMYSCSTPVQLQYTCIVVVHLYTVQLQYTCTVIVHLYNCGTLVQLRYTCTVAVHLYSYSTLVQF